MARIRVYSPHFPEPPTGGSPHVVFEQVRALHGLGHAVELVTWMPPSRPGGVASLPAEVHWVQCSVPAERRARRVLRVLGSLTSGLASPEEYYYPREAIVPALGPADLAIYHYGFAYSWLTDPRRPAQREAKRVVFFHNLESELFEQRAGVENPLWAWIQRLNARKLGEHESLLSDQVDELWFLSPADRDTYLARNPGVPKGQCRLVLPTYSPELRDARRARFLKQDAVGRPMVLGFVGRMDFRPNHRSALWVIRELAPRLKNAGFAGEILLAGAGASAELLREASAFPFIRILGFVPDLEDFWSRLSFALVPHVEGSGTRIKLLEALASGIPVLASEEAGMRIAPGLRANPLLLLSDDANQWVRAILEAPALEKRRAHLGDPFPKDLEASEVYRFLSLHSSAP